MCSLLLLALSQGPALAADPFQPELLVETLPSGLTVVVDEQHRTGDVAVHVQYRVGSRDEVAGQRGAAHLFEHLMFERSEHVPQDMFDTWVTAAGGQNNAWTDTDATAYHMLLPAGGLDLALFLESDRMGFLESALDWENLKNQQDVVIQERAEGYAEPHGMDWDALQHLLFDASHPYHLPVIGTVGDVRAFSKERARDFWRRHYAPENAVLVIVGHVDAEEAMARARHWFSDVPPREGPAPLAAPPVEALTAGPPRDGRLLAPVADWTLYLAWPAPPRGHPDEPALELLSYVLSYGRGTRLDEEIYFGRRFATWSNAWLDAGLSGSMFVVGGTVPEPRTRRLERLMEKAVRGVVRTPPADWELARARAAIKSALLDQMESPEARAEWWADCWAATGTPDCLDEEWARYERVDVGDLVAVAERWLRPETRVSLSVVPEWAGGGLAGAERVELP